MDLSPTKRYPQAWPRSGASKPSLLIALTAALGMPSPLRGPPRAHPGDPGPAPPSLRPSPCSSKAEMGHTCRGTINLATANITVEDSCNFIISNGGAQTYHLKASSEVERQRWVTALELAKAKAVKMLEESGMELLDPWQGHGALTG